MFALSTEPLAQLIRDNLSVKGIKIDKKEEHNLSLYANDVLLFLADPEITILHLKKLISHYGFISGYKVNIEKTKAIDLSGQIPEHIKNKSGLKWNKSMVYLGITLPHSLEQLYDVNYPKIIKSISEDLEHWTTLPLTMLGRIESVHMNVLPRLLYLFQMLPVEVPKLTVDRLNKLISKFIWQGKRTRVRFKN